MTEAYDLVRSLTSSVGAVSENDRRIMLRDFSNELGWRPSYHLVEGPFVGEIANAHLIVEHGLEPCAVITFLNERRGLSNLGSGELNRLMAIPYNNLVDWHLYVEPEKVTFCFNRATDPVVERREITRRHIEALRNESFEQVVGRAPSPNFPSLDDALIRTISGLKRSLSAELDHTVPNENLSALFNAILFARAVEDHHRTSVSHAQELLEEWETASLNGRTLPGTIESALRKLVQGDIPSWLLDKSKLIPFESLDPTTVHNLLSQFYRNSFAPYDYDFSIMSKHALSRIYEHYSTILHVQESDQASFFPALPEEELNRTYGSVYTPQFIAGFFARFLRNQLPPPMFRAMRTVDPACGSGIFPRTLLELQCDPIQDGVTSDAIAEAFDKVLAIDRDENACQATRLSLALLHLVLTSALPQAPHVVTAEAFTYYQDHPDLKGAFDAVIVNPPFIRLDRQSAELRQRITQFMSSDARGRIDTYLAFLRLALELLKPGGYGLFVLPHSFLVSASAQGMRERLANETAIHCLADLSSIRVFGDLGSYIVLLVFQKKGGPAPEAPAAAIIRCQDFVGHALEDYLHGRLRESTFYNIYEVGQQEFRQREWIVLPPTESVVRQRLRALPELGEIAEVHEGLITGADTVFIIDDAAVPPGEDAVFVPFLPDRAMERYHVPQSTGKRVFYPFVAGRKLSAERLQGQFPATWKYLSRHRGTLEARSPVKRGHLNWWEPVRPRLPRRLMRPKIVSPHLVILPRFCLDREGKYAVSHGPFLYPNDPTVEHDLLLFLTGVLNSPVCYWYLSSHSDKYGRGYAMLEAKTLKHLPVPDPRSVDPATMTRLLSLTNHRILNPSAFAVESQIEEIVGISIGFP